MKTKAAPALGKFYGILDREPGYVTYFIDFVKDFDNRLLRHALTVDVHAFEEYLRVVLGLPEYEINEVFACVTGDLAHEDIGNYLMISRHEWVALDEDNNIIEEPVKELHSYINQ